MVVNWSSILCAFEADSASSLVVVVVVTIPIENGTALLSNATRVQSSI